MVGRKHGEAAGPVQADAVAAPRGAAGHLRPEHLYRALGLALLLALVYRYFDALSRVFLLAYAAAILAVAFNALRAWLPLRRKWLALLVGLVVVALVVVGLGLGMPLVLREVRGLAAMGPQVDAQVARWEEQLGAATGLRIDLPSPARPARGTAAGTGELVGRAVGLIEVLFIPLIVFFGALFALASPNDRLLSPFLRALPHGVRLAWYRIFQLLAERLLGWLKGTAVAMAAVGVLSVVAYSLIGVPNALLLGLLNGLLEFIPLAGPWIGGGTATLVAFLDDPSKAMWTAGAALAIQQVEANLITPWSMSHNAKIHPFVTLFALVLCGGLFGFLGVVLALPLVLLAWTVVQVLWVERSIDTDRDRIAPLAAE